MRPGYGVELRFEPDLEPGGFMTREHWPKRSQGITKVATDGRVLAVEGWYDHIAGWAAEVELDAEQRAKLHEATA